jgi:hypothetical protein|tara:strand:- start:961 stop:1158 length:198 start_codon:yes stop_codon:yes gene_type:complete
MTTPKHKCKCGKELVFENQGVNMAKGKYIGSHRAICDCGVITVIPFLLTSVRMKPGHVPDGVGKK